MEEIGDAGWETADAAGRAGWVVLGGKVGSAQKLQGGTETQLGTELETV